MDISRKLRVSSVFLLYVMSLIFMGQAGPSGGYGYIGFLIPLIIVGIIVFGIFRLTMSRQVSKSIEADQSGDAEFEFKTLLGFGKLISGLGWILVIIGAFVSLTGFTNSGMESLFFILGGLVVAIMGLFMVANGQLISCFVSIERNTRQTSNLLLKERGESK